MSLYKQPYLEPYRGVASRHTCPACRTPRAFTFYLDGNTGRPIHPTVGRCNHEISCGYHYPPRHYFNDHPEKGSEKRVHSTLSPSPQRSASLSPEAPGLPSPSPQRPLQRCDFIPIKYLIASASFNSHFVRFLCEYFPRDRIEEAMEHYALGATRDKKVIFWQMDICGKVRTGKMMQYDPRTGKRVRNSHGGIDWVHSYLKRRNPAYADFNLCQCYFGEHLLRLYPHKPVALVEGEKTAVIGSMIYRDFIWLAAGSLHGLTAEKSAVLRDRHVVLYPDAGCYGKWAQKLDRLKNTLVAKVEISELIERHASLHQHEKGYDLADYIMEELA